MNTVKLKLGDMLQSQNYSYKTLLFCYITTTQTTHTERKGNLC